MVNFSPFLHVCSPPPTLDVNRATRAVSLSDNRPEVPPYSPARRAIVHRATRAVPRSPGFGAPYIFLYLVLSRSRQCSHPPSPHRIRHRRIVSYRSVSPVPSCSCPCTHHPPTHPHTLTLSALRPPSSAPRACSHLGHFPSLSLPLSFPPRTWCNELDAARPLNRGSLYTMQTTSSKCTQSSSSSMREMRWRMSPGRL